MKRRSLLLTLLATFSLNAAAEKIVVYNWSEYIPEGVLEKFTEQTGIEVEYTTFESNEVMYAKLQLQKGKGYDVVVPSTYYVSKMRAEGLLQQIDSGKIANFKNLDPSLLNKEYDPNNAYSIPYLWGSTGIGVNSDNVDAASITSWANLWDPKWKNKLLLIDDVREVFQMALKLDGHSPNTTNPDEIKQAYEKLKQLMPNVLVFNSDAPREPYMAGDVNLGMIWNGEAVMAQAEMPEIKYVYPKEGATMWIDSFAIPVGAPNTSGAYKFINFMLSPEVAKLCTEQIGYATANVPGTKMLAEKIRNNPAIFPDAETIAKGAFLADVGAAIDIYHSYWEQLKTGR